MTKTRLETGPQALRDQLAHIVGERHHLTSPNHHAATAELIREGFTRTGWRVSDHPVRGPYGLGANVIGRREGCVRPARTWVLGAHSPTFAAPPGPPHNGIAVAALLEAARALAYHEFHDSVELVAWDMEEIQTRESGGLLGSREMARDYRIAERDVGGVIDLEMIGLCRREPNTQRFPRGFGLLFPGATRWVRRRGSRGDFIAVLGDPRSKTLVRALERTAGEIGLPFVSVCVRGPARLIPHFYRSDHAAFWRERFPAAILTDTAEFRGEHYHSPTDTADTIDFDFAAAVATAAMHALVDLAGTAD